MNEHVEALDLFVEPLLHSYHDVPLLTSDTTVTTSQFSIKAPNYLLDINSTQFS